MRRAAPLALVMFSALACGPEESQPAYVESFADVVAHQSRNVTTDVISATRNVESATYGWRAVEPGDGDEEYLELTAPFGWLEFRAVDAEVVGVELEVALGSVAESPHRITARVNDEPCGRFTLTETWTTVRLEFSPGSVRRGPNRLSLSPRGERKIRAAGTSTPVRLRRARFLMADERPGRDARAAAIRVVRSDPAAEPSIDMPTTSRLDLAVQLPPEAKLVGSFRVDAAASEEAGSVTVSAKLFDAEGAEHDLFGGAFAAGADGRIDVGLDIWAGQEVRIRLGVAGPRNAQVRWRTARIESDRHAPLEPRPDLHEAPRSGRLGRPDIVFVLLDAARGDVFSGLSSEVATPHVDRLAAEGSRFEEARSPAPWTGLTVPSLLTGFYPDALGVRTWGDRVAENVPFLAGTLASAGYRTVLFSQHPLYRYQSDLGRGFEETHFVRIDQRTALPTVDNLVASDRPTFSLVHLLPPHDPYTPPEPFRGSLTDWYRGEVEPDAEFLSAFPRRTKPESLSDADRRYVWQRYLENVAFADDLVGRVVEKLSDAGRYEDAMIVVLSDHGEAFLEHGYYAHTRDLYREFVHVPLVVKWPKKVVGFESIVAEPVSVIDLLPTLVDGLGLDVPSDRFQGRSLLEPALGGAPTERWIYATTHGATRRHRPPRPRVAVEMAGWRLIYDVSSATSELYRSGEDPTEQHDLAAAYPGRVARLEQILLRQRAFNETLARASSSEIDERDLDPRLIEELEALGYL